MRQSRATAVVAAIATIAAVAGFTGLAVGSAVGGALTAPVRPHAQAVESAPRPSATIYRICATGQPEGPRC